MYQRNHLEPIDYLMVGHLTIDMTDHGPRLGGTAAYAALTAQALGLRVGIVTSWGQEVQADLLASIPISNYPTDQSTTFENIATPEGRIQFVYHVAPTLNYNLVPDIWRSAPIVHLGPVAQEVEPGLVRNFGEALVGITPQGWLRNWDQTGRVLLGEWPEATFVLQRAGAVVISLDDLEGDENRIEELATDCRILAVTEGAEGVQLFWNGDVRRFRPPSVEVNDTTGAGDIFAAAYFVRLYTTRDPWEATRFATQLAAYSVSRAGLSSVPTQEEIDTCTVEVY